MRHNDYMPLKRCNMCGKQVFTPVMWNSAKYDTPTYPTCPHIPQEPPKPRAKPIKKRVNL